MNLEVKTSSAQYKLQANQLFDTVLVEYESNFEALYGKSLILYQKGKIEQSAEVLKKILDIKPQANHHKVVKLKQCLIDLLEPKPPSSVDILNAIKKEYSEIKGFETITFGTSAATSIATNQLGTCGTNQRQSLMLSQQVHFPRPKEARSFFCILCNKTFSKMFSLNRHMLIHNGIKNHKCDHCGYCFVQKSDLDRHKTIHGDSWDFKCSYAGCAKLFRTKKSLRSHSKTHEDDRSVNCNVCSRSFKANRSLKTHLAAVHYGILPFICDFCGKSYPVKASLRSHMTTHSNLKPFGCPSCDSMFKRAFDLRVHSRSQHCDMKPRVWRLNKSIFVKHQCNPTVFIYHSTRASYQKHIFYSLLAKRLHGFNLSFSLWNVFAALVDARKLALPLKWKIGAHLKLLKGDWIKLYSSEKKTRRRWSASCWLSSKK